MLPRGCGPSRRIPLLCGDPARHKLPQQQQRQRQLGTKVCSQEWARLRRTFFFYISQPRCSEQQGVGCKDRPCLKKDQILEFSWWSLTLLALLDSSRFIWELKTGVSSRRKCGPRRSLALSRGLPWFFSCFSDYSVDLLLAQGRVPLPACVPGSFWTAVDWKGAKFQTRSRNGQCNCESS